MARPMKYGIDYFTVDCDIELNQKISLIEAEFGLKGFAIYMKLLARIYGGKGYYISWDSEQELILAKSVNEKACLVGQIVSRLVSRSLFNNTLASSFGILTSDEIQSRYLSATIERKEVLIVQEYWLINMPVGNKYVINSIKLPINEVNRSNNSINLPKSTQSKVKEILYIEDKTVFENAKLFLKSDTTWEEQFLMKFSELRKLIKYEEMVDLFIADAELKEEVEKVAQGQKELRRSFANWISFHQLRLIREKQKNTQQNGGSKTTYERRNIASNNLSEKDYNFSFAIQS